MPLIALNDEEKRLAALNVDLDLKWLLSDNGVDEDIQLALFHSRLKKMKLFAGMAEDTVDLCNTLATQLGIDVTTSMIERARVAAVRKCAKQAASG